jgi:class 3 adenylate cyclase
MDPQLEALIQELEAMDVAAVITDPEWRLIWVSREMKVLLDEDDEAKLGYGKHIVQNWCSATWLSTITEESEKTSFVESIPYIAHETPGGLEKIVEVIVESDRSLDDWGHIDLESLVPRQPPPVWGNVFEFIQKGFEPVKVRGVYIRLHGSDGGHIGTLQLYGSALPARILALVARGDEDMFIRMSKLVDPGRRQAAVLFADLQESGVLSRRLPSAAYFKLIAAVTSAMDDAVIEHLGIVGKHAGDGLTAFFLADDLGSPSAAAHAAICAARDISVVANTAAKKVGEETGLVEASNLQVNIGVHWGGTLYMGQLVTGGRLEVTALGDAVNECARIQESAREGDALASKSLIEHLSASDAATLGIDQDAVVYTSVSELPDASDKAKRDAGAIPVTPI